MSAKAGDQGCPLQPQFVHEKGCKYANSQPIQAAVIISTDESDTASTVEGEEDEPQEPGSEEDSAPLAAVVFSDEDDNSSSTLYCQEVGSKENQRGSPKPDAGLVAAVVISTDDSTSTEDEKKAHSPDESIVSANPATKESLSAFTRVKSLRVRIVNSAATRYEVSAESLDVPFLKAQFRCPPKGCCSGGPREGSSGGPFTIDISDFSSVADTTLVRVLCNSTGSVMVESPESEVIGYVMAERILCSLNFIIRDIYGASRIVVKGPSFCRSKCQQNEVFEILLPDETAEVATLSRATGANEYTLIMPESMTAELKASLLCVSMLFDRKMFA